MLATAVVEGRFQRKSCEHQGNVLSVGSSKKPPGLSSLPRSTTGIQGKAWAADSLTTIATAEGGHSPSKFLQLWLAERMHRNGRGKGVVKAIPGTKRRLLRSRGPEGVWAPARARSCVSRGVLQGGWGLGLESCRHRGTSTKGRPSKWIPTLRVKEPRKLDDPKHPPDAHCARCVRRSRGLGRRRLDGLAEGPGRPVSRPLPPEFGESRGSGHPIIGKGPGKKPARPTRLVGFDDGVSQPGAVRDEPRGDPPRFIDAETGHAPPGSPVAQGKWGARVPEAGPARENQVGPFHGNKNPGTLPNFG